MQPKLNSVFFTDWVPEGSLSPVWRGQSGQSGIFAIWPVWQGGDGDAESHDLPIWQKAQSGDARKPRVVRGG